MAKGILQSAWQSPDRTMMATPLSTIFAASLLLSYGACAQAGNSGALASDFPYSRLDGEPVSVSEHDPGMFAFSYRATESVPEQYDPLSSVMNIEFGDGIVTVGDAVKQVLVPIGFELVSDGERVSRLLPELLAKPLPEVQRSMEHLRAREILRTLAGPGFVLVADHVHRAVTFDPRPRYLPLGQESTPNIKPISIVPVLSSDTDALSSLSLQTTPVDVPSVEHGEWVEVKPTQSTTSEAVSGVDHGMTIKQRLASALSRPANVGRQLVTVRDTEGAGLSKSTLAALESINRGAVAGDKVIVRNCSKQLTADSVVTDEIMVALNAPGLAKEVSECPLPARVSSNREPHLKNSAVHVIEVVHPASLAGLSL